MYVCNYIPLYILIFINEMRINNEESKEKNIYYLVKITFLDHILLWIILAALAVISCLVLFIFLMSAHETKEKLKDINNINMDLLNYFITYLIPLLTLDLSNFYSIVINIILFIIIGIFHIKSGIVHYNIMLVLLGYNVFVGNEEKVYLSKKSIDEIKNNSEILKIKQIGSTKYFII